MYQYEIKHIPLIITTFIITFIIYLLLNILLYKQYIKAKNKETNEKSIVTKFIKLLKFFENAFSETYEMLFNALGKENNFKFISFVRFSLKFNKAFPGIIQIFEILPRVIICVIFLLEIAFSNTLHYYFFSLALLLIPLSLRFIVFVLTHTCEKFILEFHNYLIISSREIEKMVNGKLTKVTSVEYQMKPEFSELNIYHFLNDLYNPLCFVYECLKALEPTHKNIRFFSVYSYYTFTLLGWGYILFTIYPLF